MLFVHHGEADDDRDPSKGAKQQVRPEQDLALLLEELFVEPESVDVRRRYLLPVDEVVVPVEYQVENLGRQDVESDSAENERVEMLFTACGEVCQAEQCEEEAVEEDPSTFVDHIHATSLLVVLIAQAAVHYDAKRQKVTVRTEDQVQVQASHVVPDEFIDDKIQELHPLEQQQPLDLFPNLQLARVVDQATNHELRHHDHLEADPDFLDYAPDAMLVVFVVLLSEGELLIFSLCTCVSTAF